MIGPRRGPQEWLGPAPAWPLPLSCIDGAGFSVSSQAQHRASSPASPPLSQLLTLRPSLHSEYNQLAPPGPWPNDLHSSLPLEASFSCPSLSNNLLLFHSPPGLTPHPAGGPELALASGLWVPMAGAWLPGRP